MEALRSQLSELKEKKAAAADAEDYDTAKQLKAEIDSLTKKIAEAEDATTAPKTEGAAPERVVSDSPWIRGNDIPDEELVISHDSENKKFVITYQEKEVGAMEYKLKNNMFDPFTMYTAVMKAGLLDRLLDEGFDWAREQGMKVMVSTTYIANTYLKTHPQYQDMVHSVYIRTGLPAPQELESKGTILQRPIAKKRLSRD